MFNIKLSVFSAAAAFLLSFLIGLFSGAGVLFLIFRALIFAIIFFTLSSAGYWALSTYLPELLSNEPSPEDEAGSRLGSKVDLSVGDGDDSDIDASALYSRKGEESEDAAELEEFSSEDGYNPDTREIKPGMDQNGEAAYTGHVDSISKAGSSTEDLGTPSSSVGAKPALPASGIGDVDILPDLESLSDSFISPMIEADSEKSSVSPPTKSKAAVGGDTFDMKEMASAIQTILKRDQKG
ncbi:hypothetical protein MASR2M78_32140 [Treponema sp.]